MNGKLKPLQNFAYFTLIMAIVIYVNWPIFQPKPADNFSCRFDARSINNAFSFGAFKQPISRILLTGYIDDPFDKELYKFVGDAVVESEAQEISASARGSVFVDGKGQPIGLILTLENERFGKDWLQISTLNEGGVLDFSRSQAFLYSDQSRGDPFRLTYPVAMKCVAMLKV